MTQVSLQAFLLRPSYLYDLYSPNVDFCVTRTTTNLKRFQFFFFCISHVYFYVWFVITQ
jgi:hypothetical protein